MEIGSKASKVIHIAAPLVGIAVGVTATFNTATAKAGSNTPRFVDKVAYVTSRIIGPESTNAAFKQMFPGTNYTALPQPGINLLGPLNATTLTGVIVLVGDYLVEAILDGKFGYRYAHPLIQAMGTGLVAGGIVGGFLDPAGSTGGGVSMGVSPAVGPTTNFQNIYASTPPIGPTLPRSYAMGGN